MTTHCGLYGVGSVRVGLSGGLRVVTLPKSTIRWTGLRLLIFPSANLKGPSGSQGMEWNMPFGAGLETVGIPVRDLRGQRENLGNMMRHTSPVSLLGTEPPALTFLSFEYLADCQSIEIGCVFVY